jgi:hypothetical protein
MCIDSDVRSETNAMKDIFRSREEELDAYLKAATLVPNQQGLLAMIGGEVAGLDLVSRGSAWQLLHAKLVKSYAMDALLERKTKSSEATPDKAAAFLKAIPDARESSYPSVGYGQDYRYQGDNLVGSALLYESCVLHAAFFQISAGEKVENMAGFSRRRQHRL